MGDPFDDPGESMAPDAPDNDNFEVDNAGGEAEPGSGWYKAIVKDIRKGEGKTSGKPMFEWDVALIMSVQGDETFVGWTDTIYTSLSKKAEWKMEEALCAVGVMTPDQCGQAIKVGFKRNQVVGVLIEALIEEQEFNDRKSQRITQLRPPSGGDVGVKGDIPGDGDIPF